MVECRLCRSLLVPIPENADPSAAHGLRCPTNDSHFFVYGEPEGPMKAMRAGMRDIASGKNPAT